MPPHLGWIFPTPNKKIKAKLLHRHAQQLAFELIPDPGKLTTKISQSGCLGQLLRMSFQGRQKDAWTSWDRFRLQSSHLTSIYFW